MLISIVIPCYNVEPYVEECLESCIGQSFSKDDYEIIVINDGATDGTLDKINGFIATHDCPNLHLYNQENRGLSATRNRGLSMAKGDYVWFVDSDDFVERNALSQIGEMIRSYNQPNLVVLNTVMVEIDGKRSVVDRQLSQVESDGRFVFVNSYIYPYSAVQFYIYNRQFLQDNGFTFKEGIYFEDCLFTPLVLSRATRCVYLSEPAYIYRLRANSITTSSISEKKLHDMKCVAEELNRQIDDPRALFKDILNDAACRNFEVLFRYYILKSERSLQRKYLEMVNAEGVWKSLLPGSRIKHKVYYLIMRIYALFRG